MTNPYHAPNAQLHRISCLVSRDDWHRLQAILPEHGMQDRFLSTLFKQFIDLTSDELPSHYTPGSAQAIGHLIARLTLTPTSLARPIQNDRG